LPITATPWSALEMIDGPHRAPNRRMAWSIVRVLPSKALPTCIPRTRMPTEARIEVHE
jgi:hypothetical protein